MNSELTRLLKYSVFDDIGNLDGKHIPIEIEETCLEIIANCMHNCSQQMLKQFADGDADEYDMVWSQYESDDMTKLYAMCNGDIYKIADDLKLISVSQPQDDLLKIVVKFQIGQDIMEAIDLWYDPNISNDDQDEFDHCAKSDIEQVAKWARRFSGELAPTLVLDEIKAFSGKYIKLLDLINAIVDSCGGDDEQAVKLQ